MFGLLASVLGVRQFDITGIPDDTTFRTCMLSKEAADRMRGTLSERDALMRAWNASVAEWRAGRDRPIAFEDKKVSGRYLRTRFCVRMQSIQFNASLVLDMLFSDPGPDRYCT
jgi:hypothetical protein